MFHGGGQDIAAKCLDKLAVGQRVIYAPAKINLRLKVLGRRTDGYHLLSMLNASASLSDEISISFSAETSSNVSCHGLPSEHIPVAHNLVMRAYDLFWRSCGYDSPPFALNAQIKKLIPIGGGLGGGSSDAAVLLNFLIEELADIVADGGMCSKQTLRSRVIESALSLGADVPYAMQQGLCWVQGVGEVVTPIPAVPQWLNLLNRAVIITVPTQSVPTSAFYDFYRQNMVFPDEIVEEDPVMHKALNGEGCSLEQLLVNDFEPYIRRFRPEIGDILDHVRSFFSNTSITGSGAAIISMVTEDQLESLEDYRKSVSSKGIMVHKVKLL